MAYDAARQQHIKLLEEQLAEEESKLAEAELTLAKLTEVVARLKENVAYFRGAIAFLTLNNPTPAQENTNEVTQEPKLLFARNEAPESVVPRKEGSDNMSGDADSSAAPRTSFTSIKEISFDQNNQTSGQISHDSVLENENFNNENKSGDNKNKRNPKQMLKSQYARMTLGDAAQEIIDTCGRRLHSDEIAKELFDVRDDEEFIRARNSLATELRRGEKDGRWRKDGRGFFVSNSSINKQRQAEGESRLNSVEALSASTQAIKNSAALLGS